MALRPFQAVRIFYHVIRGTRNPRNLRHFIQVGNILNTAGTLQIAVDKVRALPGGNALFERRELPFGHDVEFFRQFAPETLGGSYYRYLKENNLNPRDLPGFELRNDGDFLGSLMRQTHDLWHLATEFDISEMGELGLQAFMAKQIRWPFALVAFGGASFRYLFSNPAKVEELVDTWARGHRLATELVPLVLVNWNELWAVPLTEVRQRLRR